MWRRTILLATLVVGLSILGYLWTGEEDAAPALPPRPETLDAAFDRREEIFAEMLADPRVWPEHLSIAVALLETEDRLLLAHRYWDLSGVSHTDRQLIFTFSARQPGNLTTLPEWSDTGESVGSIFTNAAYRWICDRPETAAIWDLHDALYRRDGTVVMRIVITDREGAVELRELPVEVIPCADRSAVSAG